MTILELMATFLARINAAEADALVALLTPDHVFIDWAGQRLDGRAAAHVAWTGYFDLIPDYQIAESSWGRLAFCPAFL